MAVASVPPASAQDFDPHGRHRPPPGANPGTKHPGHTPARPPSATPAAPDATATAALIERYTRIALARPGDAFPLERAAQLYRARDGSVKELVALLERQSAVAGPDQYASLVALAGVYKIDGRVDESIATYERAATLKPGDPAALLALAHAQQDRGDLAAAKTRYEQALPLLHTPAEREPTLRALMTLSLDGRAWDDAKSWHRQLVQTEPSSLFVRGELARELVARGEYALAESELRDVVNAARGDNRALAPALKDLGKALAKEHKNDEAIATLERALAVAGAEAGVRGEVYEAITEVYRADQRLPEWVAELEKQHPSDFPRLSLLAALYEETGDTEKALEAYRRALAVNPRQIDVRLRMIRLLQSQGEIDRAIAEYDALIRAAPNNPQFVFEECEALIQRGDRARALKLLLSLEARATSDDDVMSRVADFYQRIGEGERALRVLTRLAQSDATDPSHLVDLGDRYLQDGNEPLAMATWKRILVVVQPRARALSLLADVYLEHDKTAEALALLREAAALDHDDLGVRKQLAVALERARSYPEAIARWIELEARAKQSGDVMLARESRESLVKLWELEHVLESQVGPLSARFTALPPDIDAGRTLAEVQKRLRRLADAEDTLRKVIKLAPGDAESRRALVLVLKQGNKPDKLDEAIAVLEELVAVDPKRARETYQEMAALAADNLHDPDHDRHAIHYQQRAVELNPEDAEGHMKLGAEYETLLQDSEHAIREYRAAIQKNDRLFEVYFRLAALLTSRGETAEADRLRRVVIRRAPDDELVKRAADLSLQTNLENGSLESLEQELLPLAIGNPQRPLFRRLVVRLYESLTWGLVQRARAGSGKDSDDARASLARIGARAVKPLLDALADSDESQQRTAINVLGFVRNRNAGPALFAFATGNADITLRERAMVACGQLRDPALLPKFEALLSRQDDAPSDGVTVAAVWGLARMEDRRALGLLRRTARRGSPEARAMAVLGLGSLRDRASQAEVTEIATESGAGNTARAAAAYVLGELGGEESTTTLLALAADGDALTREMALMALARSGVASGEKTRERAVAAMADAVYEGGDPESPRSLATAERVRRAGCAALVATAKAGVKGARDLAIGDPLASVDDAISVEELLERIVPATVDAKDRAGALVAFSEPLQRAARLALSVGDRARAVFAAMQEGPGAFEPFVGDGVGDAAAHEAAEGIARGLEPDLVRFASDQDPAMRAQATLLLARSGSPAATEALVRALGDPVAEVQRTALTAIGAKPEPSAVAAVQRIILARDGGSDRGATTAEPWAMRVLAVQAMGRLGAAGARSAAETSLRAAATQDPYALVREAALHSLGSFDVTAARALALTLENDPEPRIREVARQVAGR